MGMQMRRVEDAMIVAITFHAGHVNSKDGSLYIYHPLHVMNQMALDDDDGRKVGVLHDVVEDTDCTLKYLKACGFMPHIVDAVDAITWRDGESLDDYLARVNANEIATRIKIQDATHNLDRSKRSLAENVGDIKAMKKIQGRIDKYNRVLAFLKDEQNI